MLEGRFFLGLGTGENLNKHIIGCHWPPLSIRREMLAEAISILRLLWCGGMCSHNGRYFTVQDAQIFSLPENPPPITIAAASSSAAEFAGSMGDGLISTVPQENIVQKFRASDHGAHRPCFAQMTVCWAKSHDEAKQVACEWWPVSAVPGKLMSSLSTPAEFESVAEMISADAITASLVIGPDPEPYLERIRLYRTAGFDHIYIHQVGLDQDGFFKFCKRAILPKVHK